jgi:A/G-specific adenine glycosylase
MTGLPEQVAGEVVRWQRIHGRHQLPWQQGRDPYRVWLSEVMLQQTQVSVVLGYYERFLARFPDVSALAAAPLDDVLALWSGLGYYSRARNLHRCAQAVVREHGGEFPRSAAQLETLPGIGRSTAAAIAAFCFGERVAILDGNVKRVLARLLAYDGDLGTGSGVNGLWEQAGKLLPADAADMPAYTQGLMDLGATICLARQPTCMLCPLERSCAAHARGEETAYPRKTRTLRRTSQSLWLLRAHAQDGAVWLEKRPVPGVWAGLYCLPLFDSREDLASTVPATSRAEMVDEGAFVHVLTHKDLHLHPVRTQLKGPAFAGREGGWFLPSQWESLGLPAPIRKLLAA